MGAYLYECHVRRWTVGFAAFAAMSCLAWGASASAQASSAPTIESVSVAGITEHDATLEAQINPNGLETTYQFKLGKECYPAVCELIVEIPLPVKDLSGTEGEQSVKLDLNSVGVTLQPDSEYDYSVVATNAAGETSGNGSIFATPVAPPMIESESVSNITEHDATLEAQIETSGLYTAYEFQIDTNGSYNYTKPNCPLGLCDSITVGEPLPAGLVEPSPEDIPAGSGSQFVSLDLASIGATLQPRTTYHYRVIASNGTTPTVEGPDQTFTTSSSSARPLGVTGPSATSGSDQSGTASTPAGSGGSSSSSTPSVQGLGPVGGKTTKLKSLTKTQQLANALKACEKKPKSKRAACEKQAHRKYGTVTKSKR